MLLQTSDFNPAYVLILFISLHSTKYDANTVCISLLFYCITIRPVKAELKSAQFA